MPEEKTQQPAPGGEETGETLEQKFGVPFVDLGNFKVDSEVLQMFPEKFLRDYHLVPLFRSGNTLAVAFVDPGEIQTVDEVRRMTGMEVEPMVCREIDFHQALNQYYSAPQTQDLPDEPEVASLDDLPDEEETGAQAEASTE